MSKDTVFQAGNPEESIIPHPLDEVVMSDNYNYRSTTIKITEK